MEGNKYLIFFLLLSYRADGLKIVKILCKKYLETQSV